MLAEEAHYAQVNLWFCLTVKRLSDTADRTEALVRCSIHYDSNKLASAAEQPQKEEEAAARSWLAPLARAMLQEVGIRQQQTAPSMRKKKKRKQGVFHERARTSVASILSQSFYFHLAADKQQQQQKKPSSGCPPRDPDGKGTKNTNRKKLNRTR